MLSKSLSLPTPPLWHLPDDRARARSRLGVAGHNLAAQRLPRGPPRTRMRASLYEGGKLLDVPAGTDAETATLMWLMSALEWAREGGHERLASHLEAVADDAVFEAEAPAQGAGG